MNRRKPLTTETRRHGGTEPPHPMQPVLIDVDGTPRFKANKIVQYLLNAGPFDLNALSPLPFSVEDREQFAQLIGYSVVGFGELSYVSEEMVAQADEAAKAVPRG